MTVNARIEFIKSSRAAGRPSFHATVFVPGAAATADILRASVVPESSAGAVTQFNPRDGGCATALSDR